MHACLAEIVVGGIVVETRVDSVVKAVRAQGKGSVRGKEKDGGFSLGAVGAGAVGRGMWSVG